MKADDNPFLRLAVPGLADLKPYVPGKPISELEREFGIQDSIKLASNENPLGPSERVKVAIAVALDDLGRYPDGGGYTLRRVLAERHGVESEAITLGNGSNDVLDLIARVFLRPGVESVFSEHAFAVYPISTQAVGATARVAPARDYGHDLQAMRERVTERTRVVFIANPNNPTGTWLRSGALWVFIASVPETVMVVVDEAYTEYVDDPEYPDASRWVHEFPNLIVTRTFSKAYGLAGLRVGYGISHPQVAELLNRVRQPFNVNSLAQVAALEALKDRAHLQRTIEVNRAGMRQLTEGFTRLGLEYIPSAGNFVTLNLHRGSGPVHDALLHKGCIARPVEAYGLPNHLRVSIGLEEENDRFLKALAEILNQ